MRIEGHEFSIGADPEVFVLDRKGTPVSAHTFGKGTKAKPHPIDKGAVQVDGTALEFNIDPVKSLQHFHIRIEQALLWMKQNLLPEGYKFSLSPVSTYTKEYMKGLPLEAKVLGCEPDYNAYTGEKNPTPNAKVNFRTASGHVHVGWTEGVDPMEPSHFEACCHLVKCLDLYLGSHQYQWDNNAVRRKLYGQAGAFRPKPYGLEYRVLSNTWIFYPKVREYVWQGVRFAINDAFQFDERVVNGWNEASIEWTNNPRWGINEDFIKEYNKELVA